MYETSGTGAPVAAPPAAPPPPRPPAVLAFKELGPASRFAIVMLGASLVVAIGAAVVDQMEIALSNDLQDDKFVTDAELDASDTRVGISGLVEAITLLGTAAAFIVWQYRAYKNIPAIWRRGTEHRPGWAIGAWFVPFLNLVRPYKMTLEIWKSGDPDGDPNDVDAGRRRHSDTLTLWWAFWALSWLTSWIGSRVLIDSDTEADIAKGFWLDFASQVTAIPAAAFAIALVWKCTQRQEARAAEHRAAAGVAPPLSG